MALTRRCWISRLIFYQFKQQEQTAKDILAQFEFFCWVSTAIIGETRKKINERMQNKRSNEVAKWKQQQQNGEYECTTSIFGRWLWFYVAVLLPFHSVLFCSFGWCKSCAENTHTYSFNGRRTDRHNPSSCMHTQFQRTQCVHCFPFCASSTEKYRLFVAILSTDRHRSCISHVLPFDFAFSNVENPVLPAEQRARERERIHSTPQTHKSEF